MGRLAQLGERSVYTRKVGGSIPSPPTMFIGSGRAGAGAGPRPGGRLEIALKIAT